MVLTYGRISLSTESCDSVQSTILDLVEEYQPRPANLYKPTLFGADADAGLQKLPIGRTQG